MNTNIFQIWQSFPIRSIQHGCATDKAASLNEIYLVAPFSPYPCFLFIPFEGAIEKKKWAIG